MFHVHPPYSTSVACMKEPEILQIHQNSTRYSGRYCVYNDYALPDALDEGVNIGRNLEKDVMLMINHGTD